jgi:predicted RNase H-like HicB family nuclease
VNSVAVPHISKDGFSLHVNGEDLFLHFSDFPDFHKAPAASIFNVELLHGFHLRWPDLDVDLELDSVRLPDRYPLHFRPIKYAVVIEKADGNYSAYVPDLPGCVAAADTIDETEKLIAEAIQFHIRGMHEDGLDIPPPTSIVREVPA